MLIFRMSAMKLMLPDTIVICRVEMLQLKLCSQNKFQFTKLYKDIILFSGKQLRNC